MKLQTCQTQNLKACDFVYGERILTEGSRPSSSSHHSRVPSSQEHAVDPCLCVIGGFGLLAKPDAIEAVKTVLADVEGIESIDAPGNVPRVCLVHFSSSKLMRDFVHNLSLSLSYASH